MPIYEYRCIQCGSEHELIQKITDDPKTECPECGGRLEKLISNTSFVLKGSGWYVTDYASGDRKSKMEAEKGKSKSDKESAKGASSKTDAKPSESKTEKAPAT